MKYLFIFLILCASISCFSQDKKFKVRNIYSIIINSNDDLLVRGESIDLSALNTRLTKFILNPSKAENLSESPDVAFISLMKHEKTSKAGYKALCETIQSVYDTIWEETAIIKHAKPFEQLSETQQKAIQEKFPFRVVEKTPTGFGNLDYPFSPIPPPPLPVLDVGN